MICDLHCHTTLSDGSLGIEDVIAQAKRMNIDWLSITDHDTMASFSRADVLGERAGVKMLHGVELSAWDKERNSKVHILCYAPSKPNRLEGLCLKSCEIRRAQGSFKFAFVAGNSQSTGIYKEVMSLFKHPLCFQPVFEFYEISWL